MSAVTARKSPAFLEKSVIYQIFLRAFTPEGTLSAAAAMLPHIKSIGADIVYLCPITEADGDDNREYWSDRQKKSAIGNPRNPYRLSDYFRIDPEYGTDDDLRAFIATAHATGLRVMLDLVYYHCGPRARLIDEHPDYVVRDEKGEIKMGAWHFPELNYANPALREYLWGNMEYFVREFGVDGFRCDASGNVPRDFWEEGRRRVEKIRPDIVMLAEDDKGENEIEAFDLCYFFAMPYVWKEMFGATHPISKIQDDWRKMRESTLPGHKVILGIDNHDTVTDEYDQRGEKRLGHRAADAGLALVFTLPGVPLIYNGFEVADTRRHSIWGNRFFGGQLIIDWQNALTAEGQSRLKLLRELAALRRCCPALTRGEPEWMIGENHIAYRMAADGEQVLVVLNPRPGAQTVQVALPQGAHEPVTKLSRNAEWQKGENGQLQVTLLGYGFTIIGC